MRSELQNRIGGGVADRCTALDMLGAETLDDFDSRGLTIAENAGKPSLGDQRIGELRWKARLGFWKIPPGRGRRRSGDFPMAGGRILSRRALDTKPPQRAGPFLARETRR